MTCIKKEISQPNYWGDLGKYLFSDINVNTHDNNPLSYNEVARIEAAITNVRDFLLSNEAADSRNVDIINDKLDYIVSSSKTQGRSSWVHLCIGAIVSLSATCAYSPERTNEIWLIIKRSISNFFITQ